MRLLPAGLFVVALCVGGCAGDSSSSTSLSPSEAFCADYEAGVVASNDPSFGPAAGFYVGWVNDHNGGDGQRAADRAYGFASISCSDALGDEGFRNFLASWGIDPDA